MAHAPSARIPINVPWVCPSSELHALLQLARAAGELRSRSFVRTLSTHSQKGITMVRIADGVIVDGDQATPFTDLLGIPTAGEIVAAIDRAAADRKASAIMLHLNVRGGTAACIDPITRAIAAARKRKRVVCHGGRHLLGAGYLIACATEKISADPDCLAGGIEVCQVVEVLQAAKVSTARGIGNREWQLVWPHPSVIDPILDRIPSIPCDLAKREQWLKRFGGPRPGLN